MNTAISGLNALYSEMMIIVGETPDAYRDYNLDESIPELKDSLKKYAEELNKLGNMLDNGKEQNGNTARVYEAARTFEKMSGNAREIPQQLDNFRSQINTLADLLGSIRSQPLELDYITLTPPGKEPESRKTDFADYIKFRFSAFIGSFISDYTAVSKSGNDSVCPVRRAAQGGVEARRPRPGDLCGRAKTALLAAVCHARFWPGCKRPAL